MLSDRNDHLEELRQNEMTIMNSVKQFNVEVYQNEVREQA